VSSLIGNKPLSETVFEIFASKYDRAWTHTDTHTKVKTVCPPVSLSSLGAYNNLTKLNYNTMYNRSTLSCL